MDPFLLDSLIYVCLGIAGVFFTLGMAVGVSIAKAVDKHE